MRTTLTFYVHIDDNDPVSQHIGLCNSNKRVVYANFNCWPPKLPSVPTVSIGGEQYYVANDTAQQYIYSGGYIATQQVGRREGRR